MLHNTCLGITSIDLGSHTSQEYVGCPGVQCDLQCDVVGEWTHFAVPLFVLWGGTFTTRCCSSASHADGIYGVLHLLIGPNLL